MSVRWGQEILDKAAPWLKTFTHTGKGCYPKSLTCYCSPEYLVSVVPAPFAKRLEKATSLIADALLHIPEGYVTLRGEISSWLAEEEKP